MNDVIISVEKLSKRYRLGLRGRLKTRDRRLKTRAELGTGRSIRPKARQQTLDRGQRNHIV